MFRGVDGLSCERSLEEPDDYGEVAALVVGGEDDGVFFFGRHAWWTFVMLKECITNFNERCQRSVIVN